MEEEFFRMSFLMFTKQLMWKVRFYVETYAAIEAGEGKIVGLFPELNVKNRKVTIYISHTSEWQ